MGSKTALAPAPGRAGKPGKPPNASESEIAHLITQGKSNSEIARALHVDRKRVAKVRDYQKSLSSVTEATPIDTIKAIVRLELSQEETLNEFTDQMSEYTRNYRSAMRVGDEDAAGKWAVLRLRLLEHMIKISGLSERCTAPAPSPQELLSKVPDEEVIGRVRAILARRDG